MSDIDIKRGMEKASLILSRPDILLPDHSYNIHLKLTRLELNIERCYQTHSHNISLKISQKVMLRRSKSLSKIH